jgi:hypothetical protein
MAYVDQYERWWGLNNIESCIVDATNNTITINLDNTDTHTLVIPEKTYKWDDVPRISEIINEINTQLIALDAKVRCRVGGVKKDIRYSCLVFYTTDETVKVSSVTGTFATAFFE